MDGIRPPRDCCATRASICFWRSASAFWLATIAAALATVVSTWLALLIVTGGLFLLAGVLAVFGIGRIKKGTPPVPEQAIAEAKLTAEALRNGKH